MVALGLHESASGALTAILGGRVKVPPGRASIAVHRSAPADDPGAGASKLRTDVALADEAGWVPIPVASLEVPRHRWLDAGRLLGRFLDAWGDGVVTVVVGGCVDDDGPDQSVIGQGLARCRAVAGGFGSHAILLAPPLGRLDPAATPGVWIEPRWRERLSRREVVQWQLTRLAADAGIDGIAIDVIGAPLSSLDHLESTTSSRRLPDGSHRGGAAWRDLRDAAVYAWRKADARTPCPIVGVTASIGSCTYPRGWLANLSYDLNQAPNVEWLLWRHELDMDARDDPDAGAREDFVEGLLRWT